MKKFFAIVVIAGMAFTSAGPAFADSSSDMMSMLESMKEQMAQMQQTIDAQNRRLQELESSKVSQATQSSTPMASPTASPQLSEADWQKGIKDNIGEAVPWLKGAKFGGDFRLRYEAFDFEDANPDEVTSSDRSRNRFRIRLRWGFEKDYGDDWKMGFRLASATAGTNGVSTDNTSTNVTLGNPGYFTFKNVYIDRAYAQYSPNGLKDYGLLKGVTVGAGKFDNPFLRYSTAILWDGDVTPEGIYEKATLQLLSQEDNRVNLHLVSGQFIANENSGWESDANIFGYQGALAWSTYNFGTETPVELSAAASYYDYTNWANTIANNSASTSYLRTNTLAATTFRVLDIYPEIAFQINRTPITLWGDYVKNLGNKGTENIALSSGNDIHDKDTAWGLGIKIGKAKKKGNWELHYGYYEIGANAVVAAFNDSDFGGPGGVGFTNRQGHKFGLGYQLTDAITVNWTGYVVTPLNPGSVVASSINESVFRSQLDAVYKF